jgi:DNA-binding NarL/FixJ family response regulator
LFIEVFLLSIKEKLLFMPKKALLIVDDHPVYRDALGEKFCYEFAKWQLPVKLASDTVEGVSLLNSLNDHEWVVILDILLHGISGEAAIELFRAHPNVKHVVAISGLDESEWGKRALRSGASAFISKNNVSQFICDRVKELMEMPSEQAPSTDHSPTFRLTSRQKEVLTLIANGHPNKIIADQLSISEQTVKIHINQIFRELKVFNRTQAVLIAQKFLLV